MASRKRRGCLGLMGILVLLAVVNWGLSWHYRRAAIALTPEGYPKTYSELVQRHNRNDGSPNGADDLLAAFRSFTDDEIDTDVVPMMGADEAWPAPGEVMRPDLLIEMNKLVWMNQESLALLRSGARAADVRFPIHADETLLYPLEQFSEMRSAVALLVVKALCEAEAGDVDSAIDVLETVLMLSDWYARQPSNSAYWSGMTAIRLSTRGAARMIERGWVTHPEHFARMSTLFEAGTTGDSAYVEWSRTLWGEQFSDQPVPLSEDLGQILVDETWGGAAIEIPKHLFYTYSVLKDSDRLQIRRLSATTGERLREPMRNGLANVAQLADEKWLFWGELAGLQGIVMFNLSGTIWIEGKYRSELRSTAAAIRIAAFHAEHKRLPNADEYVTRIKPAPDPVDGELLRYRATDDGFIVYSVGPNGVDDGGSGNRLEEFVTEFRLPRRDLQ